MTMRNRYFWQALSQRCAVLWTEKITATESTVTGPMGFVLWGQVDAASLRIPLSRLSHNRVGFPIWEQREPPTAKEMARKWAATQRERSRAQLAEQQAIIRRHPRIRDEDIQSPLEDGLEAYFSSMRVGWPEGSMPKFRVRGKDETVEAFYERVADFYRVAAVATGKPTLALGQAGGVPKTTAARWVREARWRGFLPTTSKGQVRT